MSAHGVGLRRQPTDDAEQPMLRYVACLGLGLLAPVSWCVSQVTWRPAAGLSSLQDASPALAYDSARNTFVLVGGRDPERLWLLAVHELGPRGWERRRSAAQPPWRTGHGIAFDASRGVVVLFGGESGGLTLDDTWEWDGTSWRQLLMPSRPSSRCLHGISYDSSRRRCVLIGGVHADRSSVTLLNDVWEYRGQTGWTRVPVIGSPPPSRHSHATAYDSDRDIMHVFGGYNGGALPDHWLLLGGSTWFQNTIGTLPTARYGAAMCFDSVRKRMVLVGGATALQHQGLLGDVWELDSAALRWQRRDPIAPLPARAQAGLAAGGDREPPLLFGGYLGPASGFLRDGWRYLRGCERTTTVTVAAGMSLRCLSEPVLGTRWCVGVERMHGPAGVHYLIAAGECPAGAWIDASPFCGPQLLHVSAPTSTFIGPPSACADVPALSSLLGVRLCVQALGSAAPTCLGLTNGVDVALHR